MNGFTAWDTPSTQILPSTARELKLDISTPEKNILAGARYLKILEREFQATDLMLAAYNAGPTAVAKAGPATPSVERVELAPRRAMTAAVTVRLPVGARIGDQYRLDILASPTGEQPPAGFNAARARGVLEAVRDMSGWKDRGKLPKGGAFRFICASESFKGRRLDEVSVIQVEGYKRERKAAVSKRGRPFKLSSLNKELTILSRAFRLAVEGGLVRQNPVRQVKFFDEETAPFRVLERDEELRLWEALRAGPWYLLPFAMLALLTGMREGELLNLRVPDVDFGRSLVFVRAPKWKQDPRKTEGLPAKGNRGHHPVAAGIDANDGRTVSPGRPQRSRSEGEGARHVTQADEE